LIGETGTTNFGVVDITYPANIRFQAQVYYGSIGYATASTLGMDIARKEVEKRDGGDEGAGRTVLVTGDGSMALTIQEIGTMIKQKLKVVIFVINNEGYTVERLIWGARQRMYISFTLLRKHRST
jgi:pyruvate decarboxylase